ncbi:Dihydroorotate dehydrogenase (quinone) [Caulifigura coniformis]|uniref:Dihydroorotate dehydrogenase (quinone) n=1 Tax=Caulifigura coniformis TaxID=2527983 RepID=A0A517S981_9PLAN|nr:quinone-dependent dihydroorotate dehydrogenase [Caulifigura coniformis]QDT52685.1 Dihydroorotate dehydrogenase (quinone) [Caulifigura coniformis]
MLYRCLKPLLFRMDAEKAHNFALRGTGTLSAMPPLARLVRSTMARPKADVVSLMGLTFPHRVGLAAGLDKNGVAPWAWWAFGFGFVELGTVTPKPQDGNPKPRMFRLIEERAVVNRMGFNNAGAPALAARLQGAKPSFPVIVSVGKNATTPLENAESDYQAAAAAVASVADAISINISSPNTAGLRSLQTPELAGKLVTVIREVAPSKPILVKFAPELSGDDLAAVIDACLTAGAAGFIATNTLSTAVRPELPQGGLSGRPLKEISPQRVEEIRRRLGTGPTLIGCGGIEDAATARRMRDAGADLVQVYTALVYQGPFLAASISRELSRG